MLIFGLILEMFRQIRTVPRLIRNYSGGHGESSAQRGTSGIEHADAMAGVGNNKLSPFIRGFSILKDKIFGVKDRKTKWIQNCTNLPAITITINGRFTITKRK